MLEWLSESYVRLILNPSCFRRRMPAALIVFVFLLGGGPAPEAHPPASAVDFEAIGLDGQPYQASRLQGQVVLIDFWATWCAPCIKAIPSLNRLREEFKPRGFEVLGVASYSGTLEDIRSFLESRSPQYPIVLADEDLVERFGVVGYPTYFLVDRQGRIAETYVGEIESQLDEVRDRIRALTGETK